MKKLYGWYSHKQANIVENLHVYKRENGTEVLLTQVTSVPDHRTNFDDMEMVARVVQHVRSARNHNSIGGTITIV